MKFRQFNKYFPLDSHLNYHGSSQDTTQVPSRRLTNHKISCINLSRLPKIEPEEIIALTDVPLVRESKKVILHSKSQTDRINIEDHLEHLNLIQQQKQKMGNRIKEQLHEYSRQIKGENKHKHKHWERNTHKTEQDDFSVEMSVNLMGSKQNIETEQKKKPTLKGATNIWQQIYHDRHSYDIKNLKYLIEHFSERLDKLISILKNEVTIKKFLEGTFINPEFSQFFMKQDGVLIIQSSPQHLEKYFQYKDTVHIGDHQVVVTKFNFNFNKDLQDATDKINEVLQKHEMKQYENLKRSMTKELGDVRYMQQKFIYKTHRYDNILLKEGQMSYNTPTMHNRIKESLLGRVEKSYGRLERLKQPVREINDNLNLLIDTLYDY